MIYSDGSTCALPDLRYETGQRPEFRPDDKLLSISFVIEVNEVMLSGARALRSSPRLTCFLRQKRLCCETTTICYWKLAVMVYLQLRSSPSIAVQVPPSAESSHTSPPKFLAIGTKCIGPRSRNLPNDRFVTIGRNYEGGGVWEVSAEGVTWAAVHGPLRSCR